MKNLIAILIIVLFVSGCVSTASVYPVRGPLAESGNAQPLVAEFTDYGLGDLSGKITIIMPWGEKATGAYSVVRNSSVSWGAGSANIISSSQLGTMWTTVYGNNFTVTSSGQSRGMATLIGDQGIIIEAEFLVGSFTSHGFGVAKDNKGNYYRIHF